LDHGARCLLSGTDGAWRHLNTGFGGFVVSVSAASHWSTIRGGADKSLARPGRKQVTATILGIYSTCSPRSSIHFLARCSNFCKPLKKKKSEGYPSNQVSAAAMTSASDEKWRPFNCIFSVKGTGGSSTGPDRRIGWVIKTWEGQVGQFLLGCRIMY